MEKYILLTGCLLTIIGYLMMMVEMMKNKEESDLTGFDIAKEILDYDTINIIESKNVLISNYHLKRKVIRLTPKIYASKSLFSLAVASLLSCISLVKNQYMRRIEKILPSITIFNISSMIMLFISSFIHVKADAKIGIILGIILLIDQYFYLQVLIDSIEIAKERIKKKRKKVLPIMQQFYQANRLLWISTLVFLLRLTIIILK